MNQDYSRKQQGRAGSQGLMPTGEDPALGAGQYIGMFRFFYSFISFNSSAPVLGRHDYWPPQGLFETEYHIA